MSIREKDGRLIVEIYDGSKGSKVHVRPSDFGMEQPKGIRAAQALERAALNARDARRPGSSEETIRSFAARWPDDYSGPIGRGESTRALHRRSVKAFAKEFGDRRVRSFTRTEARSWVAGHPGSFLSLRAMFADAVRDRLADENPFGSLGIAKPKGREDITVLTGEEVGELAHIARVLLPEGFGGEFAATIEWATYTLMRPGEVFASRFSLLDGDVYHLQRQWNARLGKETAPKHDGTGMIYVPEQALRAVTGKPRRLGDDLMFRSIRGKQFSPWTHGPSWRKVRDEFTKELPKGHHLRQRLALDPEDRLDLYELRHRGASHMLNDLGVEPWVIAEQLRHRDGGDLVIRLYGHPSREEAIRRMRRAHVAGSTEAESVREMRQTRRSA